MAFEYYKTICIVLDFDFETECCVCTKQIAFHLPRFHIEYRVLSGLGM